MATAKIRSASLHLLETLGVRHHFDYIIASDDMQRMKPDPQSVQMVLEHFQAAPEEAVFVGDMKTDVMAGRAAGVHTIGVSYGYGDTDSLREAGADLIVDSPQELVPAIAGL